MASRRLCDATLPQKTIEVVVARDTWVSIQTEPLQTFNLFPAMGLVFVQAAEEGSLKRSNKRRSNMPSGMHALCAAQFSYSLSDIGIHADILASRVMLHEHGQSTLLRTPH